MATASGKKNVNLNMDIALWEQLSRMAKIDNRSLSNLVCTILKNYVESQIETK